MSRAHSAVVRAPMARREGILVCLVECNVLWMAFKLLMGIVSQRPALIKVGFFGERKCWSCKVKMSVLVGRKVQRGRNKFVVVRRDCYQNRKSPW